MECNDSFLDISIINPDIHYKYFKYPDEYGNVLEFNSISDWRDYLKTLCIQSNRVPLIHVNQFHVALRIMFLLWADNSIIKAAEMAALSALESGLKGAYFAGFTEEQKKSHKELGVLLDYMRGYDNLLFAYHNKDKKQDQSALNRIRNGIAHGDLFKNMPWGGLMTAVRDVMEHAFRKWPEHDPQLLLLEKYQNAQAVHDGARGIDQIHPVGFQP